MSPPPLPHAANYTEYFLLCTFVAFISSLDSILLQTEGQSWRLISQEVQFSSVQFSPSTDWVVRGTWGTIQQRSSSSLFCRGSPWAVLAWAGMLALRCCPSIISFAVHSLAHPPRCLKGWFWRGCHGVWRARTMQASVSWQLPEEVPVDPSPVESTSKGS